METAGDKLSQVYPAICFHRKTLTVFHGEDQLLILDV